MKCTHNCNQGRNCDCAPMVDSQLAGAFNRGVFCGLAFASFIVSLAAAAFLHWTPGA